MTVTEIFSDFMRLDYIDTWDKHTRPGRLRDIKIDSLIIARITQEGCRVIYLNQGNQLFIPWMWTDMFQSLAIHSGDKIKWNQSTTENNDAERLERFICDWVELGYCLSGGISTVGSDIFLDTLGNICSIGTGKFRTWCKTEFELNLEPLQFISLDESIEI